MGVYLVVGTRCGAVVCDGTGVRHLKFRLARMMYWSSVSLCHVAMRCDTLSPPWFVWCAVCYQIVVCDAVFWFGMMNMCHSWL